MFDHRSVVAAENVAGTLVGAEGRVCANTALVPDRAALVLLIAARLTSRVQTTALVEYSCPSGQKPGVEMEAAVA
jgi:hypothetical protein